MVKFQYNIIIYDYKTDTQSEVIEKFSTEKKAIEAVRYWRTNGQPAFYQKIIKTL